MAGPTPTDAEATPGAIPWAKPEDVGMSRERLARIGEWLDRDVAAGLLPGAVALVARHGRVVSFKAYGRRDPEAADPMRLDSIFRIYSMTKPIVSVAAMMLVEEGRLSLGDPLARYIPAFADMQVAEQHGGEVVRVAAARPITIHDLFRHTSGLTYEWLDPGPAGQAYIEAGLRRRSLTNEETVAILATLPLSRHPGQSWVYSVSTDVLGRVIEVVSGESLGRHLDRRVFEPLGMHETGFVVPGDLRGRLAGGFPTDPETGEPVQLLDVVTPAPKESGGGGLASTTGDYGRFAHMLASGGVLDGVRVLSPATLRWMMSDHLGPGVEPISDLLPPGYGFGLGFAVRRTEGQGDAPGSAGDAYWLGLAGTNFWIDPMRGLHAVLMVQAPGRREHYRRTFRQLVYAALVE